jgi:hypothetical protein
VPDTCVSDAGALESVIGAFWDCTEGCTTIRLTAGTGASFVLTDGPVTDEDKGLVVLANGADSGELFAGVFGCVFGSMTGTAP